jgi:hypothetical protein
MPFGNWLTFQGSKHVKEEQRKLKVQGRGIEGKGAGKGGGPRGNEERIRTTQPLVV